MTAKWKNPGKSGQRAGHYPGGTGKSPCSDRITVDYYGVATSLQQVANITVPEARMIQIQPWESSLIKEICKAIQKSDLGINPNTDGKVVRLVFPELTEERRKELVKEVKKKARLPR